MSRYNVKKFEKIILTYKDACDKVKSTSRIFMTGDVFMKSIIAENVKSIITQKGYTQSSVAARAGYDRKVFNNLLNHRKTITDADVPKIANALGVTPNELFGISSPQPPQNPPKS